jgi:hypothetical protein
MIRVRQVTMKRRSRPSRANLTTAMDRDDTEISMSSRPVPIFFEPGAPPPVLPLPTCQTSFLHANITDTATIWRQEVCRPSRRGREAVSAMQSVNRARMSSPYPRSTVTIPGVNVAAHTSKLVNRHPSPMSDLTDSEASSTCSTSEASEGPSDLGEPIPKPPGDVARPKRGGYNLAKALGWPNEKLEKLRV